MGANKIGLLTFHRPLNYGAVMQTIALYKVLSIHGDTELLDFRNADFENLYGLLPRNWKNCIKRLIFPKETIKLVKKRMLFDRFIKDNCVLSHHYTENNISECDSRYAVFFVGSDQVWRPGSRLHSYLLDFCTSKNKFSYASSIGIDCFDENESKYLDLYRDNISKFKCVSVRERSGVALLAKLVETKIVEVLDPVYLLEQNEWHEIAQNRTTFNERGYVLLYLTQIYSDIVEFGIKLSENRKIKLVTLNSKQYRLSAEMLAHVEVIDVLSPYDWIKMIENADLVITNSFHGLSFAIIMRKNFYWDYLKPPIRSNERLRNIAETFSVCNRNIGCYSKENAEIDWKKISSTLEIRRKESMNFLNDCFDKVE